MADCVRDVPAVDVCIALACLLLGDTGTITAVAQNERAWRLAGGGKGGEGGEGGAQALVVAVGLVGSVDGGVP